MTRFLDGPARGKTLLLRRAPVYLRVVIDPGGRVDALDQLDDRPGETERVHVYKRVEGTQGVVCIRPGGCYRTADYRHVGAADGERLRDRATWQKWVGDQVREAA